MKGTIGRRWPQRTFLNQIKNVLKKTEVLSEKNNENIDECK